MRIAVVYTLFVIVDLIMATEYQVKILTRAEEYSASSTENG